MPATRLRLYGEQGATFNYNFTVVDRKTRIPVDQTGNTYTGQVRLMAGAQDLLATLTCTLADQTLFPGKVLTTISAADMEDLPMVTQTSSRRKPNYFALDIDVTYPNGSVYRRVQAIFEVSPGVIPS